MPAVSVIIPFHNRAAELPLTLESVLAQTFADWEAVLVDDRSTDNAYEVACGFAEKDKRFRVLKIPANKQGAPAARNFGAAQSTGEFIVFLDSDDALALDCLAHRIETMRARPDLDFGIWRSQLFRTTPGDEPFLWNADTGEDDLLRFLKLDVPWQTTSPMWRRPAFEKLGGWDEAALSSQDWEFHIRAILAGLKYERFREIDCHWRAPDASRQSIGKVALTKPEHVRSRAKVIEGLLQRVRDKGRFDEKAKPLFAGLYFHTAEDLRRRATLNEGLAFWRSALAHGLIDATQYRDGAKYLKLPPMEWKTTLAREALARRWPACFTRLIRPYFTHAPLDGHVPAVSMIVSVYNNAPFVKHAVESILMQTFADWELIVIDDGSTDGTGEILQRFADSDCRIRLTRRANKGRTVSLNEAIDLARGEFLARFDFDDLSLPERFEKQVAFLRANPDVVAIGSQIERIDPYGVLLDTPKHHLDHDGITHDLLAGSGWAIVHPVVMMRRDAVEKVGRYNPHFNDVEDLELFLRLGEVGRLANLPDVLLKYRQHPASVNATRFELQRKLANEARTQASARRRIPVPPESPHFAAAAIPRYKTFCNWGWKALKRSNRSAARKHAVSALKEKPFAPEVWRLLVCAIRGH
ncbi:MAG: glycosyltransferase family 2 protein [Tepidisphaeraceae bacterium]